LQADARREKKRLQEQKRRRVKKQQKNVEQGMWEKRPAKKTYAYEKSHTKAPQNEGTEKQCRTEFIYTHKRDVYM